MMPTIWERYFYKELAKVFFLFIGCFYFLYILIDFSSQMGTFLHRSYTWQELSCLYLYTFIRRFDIILPFALLLASIKTLIGLNQHNELVALLANGISLKRLLRPFIVTGLLLVSFLYFSLEKLLPSAMESLQQLQNIHNPEMMALQEWPIKELSLPNGEKILYQYFDPLKNFFFDAYWIRSFDDIYHIKYLIPDADYTVGHFVDHIAYDPAAQMMQITDSLSCQVFTQFKFKLEPLKTALTAPEDQALSKLWSQLPTHYKQLTDRQADVLTSFCFKLAIPLLPLLAIAGPAPFCLRTRRLFSPFSIYVPCIFGFLAFYLLMDALAILGQNQVIHPLFTLILPLFIYTLTFISWKRLR